MEFFNPIQPSTFGPFNTQEGGQICPQAFSWTPEGSHLLKNGLKIKFPQKSSDNDPV